MHVPLSYFSTKTYVVGTQKNRLNETVLLSTQNICKNWWVRKHLQFYAKNFCLSKPVELYLPWYCWSLWGTWSVYLNPFPSQQSVVNHTPGLYRRFRQQTWLHHHQLPCPGNKQNICVFTVYQSFHFVWLVWCFMSLSTAMVMSGLSVHLTTLFS